MKLDSSLNSSTRETDASIPRSRRLDSERQRSGVTQENRTEPNITRGRQAVALSDKIVALRLAFQQEREARALDLMR